MWTALLAAPCALLASPVWAASVDGGGGFFSGAAHPVLGFDHLAAMVMVGLLSVRIGGIGVWATPAAFVLVMALGGGLGVAGVQLPYIEGVNSISVLALGLLIASSARPPLWLAMIVVGLFAMFLGHAHGAQAPSLATPGAYIAGFMLATATLHLIGVGVGAACRLFRDPEGSRALVGAGAAGVGLHMSLLSYGVV